jgi:hypothetical protein
MNAHKYPRTFHLPWSPGKTNDDKVLDNVKLFETKDVVVSLKMDGENTSMYRDHLCARSVSNMKKHTSREWIKAFHASIANNIPEGWRLCGENLWAMHSIHYDNLPSYFMGFSVWDDNNQCLSWDDTTTWLQLLGITPVREIYRGSFSEDVVKKVFEPFMEEHEGYVVRLAEGFPYAKFKNSVAKYVRKNHVQTDEHWLTKTIVRNKLKP